MCSESLGEARHIFFSLSCTGSLNKDQQNYGLGTSYFNQIQMSGFKKYIRIHVFWGEREQSKFSNFIFFGSCPWLIRIQVEQCTNVLRKLSMEKNLKFFF